jgi:hypothetical protein
MITYSNIVTKFEEFVEAHHFLKTFSHGSPSDVDLEKFEVYPLLHLVYTGGSYEDNAKTYNLEVYILDVPPAEIDKVGYQKSSITASEQAAEDILADIENGGNIFQFGYHYALASASITPLEETQSNTLAGTLLTLGIEVAYTYDSCNAPLEGIAPEGSLPPAYQQRGLLRVRELDGSPDVLSVATINVPNDSLTDDGNGEITLEFGQADGTRLVQTVKNVSGGELTKGTPVHAVVDGAEGNLAYVIAARADTASAMPATFVLNETLADEAEGEAIITGLLSGVDTDAFAPGDVVYVGATGGYTNVKPTGTNLIQNLGIVLKSHPSNGSGIVYGAGRSNDVPNLPDGRFFIGSATNTTQSEYGMPTTAPNNNETLVYDDGTDEFVAGYPVAAGQQSTFSVTDSTSIPFFSGTGIKYVDFGSYLGGTAIVTQENRAGFNMGMSIGATEFLAAPLALASTYQLTWSVEILAPVGAIATIRIAGTGWFNSTSADPIIGDSSWTTYTQTTSLEVVSFWQLANTARLEVNIIANPTSITYRNPTFSLTINHA